MAIANKINNISISTMSKLQGVSLTSIGKITGINKTSNQPSIITTNLVQHLDAGDSNSYPGTGTSWSDLTTNNVDATLVNDPTYSSTDGGGSFQFDGVDDSIKINYADSAVLRPTANDLDTNGFTFQFWAKNIENHSIQFSTNNYASTNYYYGIECVLGSNANGERMVGHIMAGLTNNSPSSRRSAFTAYGAYNPATWYLFTFGFGSNEAADIEFYINGTSTAVSSTSGTGGDTSPGYSSGRDAGIGYCRGAHRQGYISQIIAYDTLLSATDVTTNFNATKTRYGY